MSQRHREGLSEQPHTVAFQNITNRGSLVRGLRDAGFDLDGAQTFHSFHEPTMDIVFVTRRHGERVVEALQEGFRAPWMFQKIAAVSKNGPACDETVDILGRNADKPVPEVQDIRDRVLEAHGFPAEQKNTCVKQVATTTTTEPTTELKTDNTAENEEYVAEALAQTAPQRHLTGESRQIATWVEDETRFVLIKEPIGKRKRAGDDEDRQDDGGREDKKARRPQV